MNVSFHDDYMILMVKLNFNAQTLTLEFGDSDVGDFMIVTDLRCW